MDKSGMTFGTIGGNVNWQAWRGGGVLPLVKVVPMLRSKGSILAVPGRSHWVDIVHRRLLSLSVFKASLYHSQFQRYSTLKFACLVCENGLWVRSTALQNIMIYKNTIQVGFTPNSYYQFRSHWVHIFSYSTIQISLSQYFPYFNRSFWVNF